MQCQFATPHPFAGAGALSQPVPLHLAPSSPLTSPQLLFEQYIDANAVVAGLQRGSDRPSRMTPKMFMHTLKTMCK